MQEPFPNLALYAAYAPLACGVVVHAASGAVLYANEAAETLLGLSLTQLRDISTRDSHWQLLREDGSTLAPEEWPALAALRTGQPQRGVILCLALPSGEWRWLEAGAALVFDAAGVPLQAVFTFWQIKTAHPASEERLRLLESAVVHSRDAVTITRVDQAAPRDSPVVFVNDAFTQLTGYARDDILGKSSSLLDGAETDPLATMATLQALLRGESAQAELLTYRKDGSTYWADYSVVPAPDATGRMTHWISFERDITQRKRTEEALRASEERLRTVVGNAPLVLFAYDREGIVSLAMGGGLSLLGFQPEDRIGRSIHELYRERPDILANCVRALAGETLTAVYPFNDRMIEVRLLPQFDAAGMVRGAISVAFDVTEHARAQYEADHARAAAEELATLRSDFVAAVSHELRTPLTAIIGYAELLQARWDRFSDEQRLDRITRIVHAANRQLRLVKDLLLLRGLEAEKLEIAVKPVSIDELVLPAVEEMQGSYPRQQITLVGSTNLQVQVDAPRTIQVLANMLDNAAKYSPEGSPITLSWDVDGAMVVVRITDRGSGVPVQGRDHLFTRFGRVPGSRIRAGHVGTGLGLYISRDLAEAMGGGLDLESTSPDGSTFRLWLQRAIG